MSSSVVPEPPARGSRGCLPVVAIGFVIAVVSLGGWIVGAAAPRRPVLVRPGLSFRPPSGWAIEKRTSRGAFEGVVLTNGTSHATVVTAPASSGSELLSSYEQTILEADVRQAVLSDEKEDRVAYAALDREGEAVEGEVFAIMRQAGFGAVVDGRSGKGEYAKVRAEIDEIVRAVRRAG